MTRWRVAAAGLALAAAVAGAVGGGLFDARPAVLAAAGLTAGAFVRLIVLQESAGPPGPFTRLRATPPSAAPLASDLRSIEDHLVLAGTTAGDAHRLLRPMLAGAAAEWLMSTSGVGLSDPSASRLLPPDVWEVVRPDAPRPEHPHAAGPAPDRIERMVSALEALG